MIVALTHYQTVSKNISRYYNTFSEANYLSLENHCKDEEIEATEVEKKCIGNNIEGF